MARTKKDNEEIIEDLKANNKKTKWRKLDMQIFQTFR